MKSLYLLRHAKAEPGTKEINDRSRPLSPRGHEACALMGAYMKSKGYAPGLILSSPSVRTRETLELVTQEAGLTVPSQFEDSLYLASADDVIRAVHGVDKTIDSVMVVGHNPGMHHVALLFSQTKRTALRTSLEIKYPTCTLTVLNFDSAHWQGVQPGKGVIADFMTPDEL